MFVCNFWVRFPFASVRVVCSRELCPLGSSRPGACGRCYMLGFSGKRDLLNFVSAESLAVPSLNSWGVPASSVAR